MMISHTASAEPLPVLYRDEHCIAIDKPAGLQVHRSRISQAAEFALQRLRDQIGQRVYPVHRLDRPTSGVLLFGLNPTAARALAEQFQARLPRRSYLAVVRGYPEPAGRIDYPLQDEHETEPRQAITSFRRLATVELPFAVSRYPTSRYALVEAELHTGRRHQIRRHFAHIAHPLIGDTTHGQGSHNRLFRQEFGIHRLLLHAQRLQFEHPRTGRELAVTAPLPREFELLFERFEWHHARQEVSHAPIRID